MTNLTALMNQATAAHNHSPSQKQTSDDLLRGRRASRRHRSAFGLSGIAAVGAAALAIGIPLGFGSTAASATELVHYAGNQPAGFTVEQIPEGWSLYLSDKGALILTDDGSTADGNGLVSFEDRIVVSLVTEESIPNDLPAQTLSLDTGSARTYDLLGGDGTPDGTRGVFVPDGDSTYLSVQIPPILHWTNETTADFIEGLHTTSNAVMTRG